MNSSEEIGNGTGGRFRGFMLDITLFNVLVNTAELNAQPRQRPLPFPIWNLWNFCSAWAGQHVNEAVFNPCNYAEPLALASHLSLILAVGSLV